MERGSENGVSRCFNVRNIMMKDVRVEGVYRVFWLQVTTVPDEGENSFKMPRASVVHMTSTATRPQHMSQVSILFSLFFQPTYGSLNRTTTSTSCNVDNKDRFAILLCTTVVET